MKSTESAKYKFAESIISIMQTKSLDKITVREITDGASLTRQTFYRNFKDKYDLVNWYFEKLLEKSIKQMGEGLTLKEGLMKKFIFIREEKTFFTNAFKSRDQNSLIEYDFEAIFKFYTGVITKKTGKKLEKDIEFLLEMYCAGSIDMTVKWIEEGMRISEDEVTDMLIEALPEKLKSLLSDLQLQ